MVQHIMGKHNRAVRKFINSRLQTHNVQHVKADLEDFPSPEPVGQQGHIPDAKIKYTNGREELLEIDTKPMSAKDRKQHEAFKQSANAKPGVRSYTHEFASELL